MKREKNKYGKVKYYRAALHCRTVILIKIKYILHHLTSMTAINIFNCVRVARIFEKDNLQPAELLPRNLKLKKLIKEIITICY